VHSEESPVAAASASKAAARAAAMRSTRSVTRSAGAAIGLRHAIERLLDVLAAAGPGDFAASSATGR